MTEYSKRDDNACSDVVLIISSEVDPHADAAVRRLGELGARVLRWHTADFPARNRASYRISDEDGPDGVLNDGHREVRLSEIRSVWYRRPEPSAFPENFDPFWSEFASAQANHFQSGLWQTLDCFWISPPPAIRAAEWKIGQLALAKQLGFLIPRTIVTNDAAHAWAFCGGRPPESTIYKPLRVPPVVRVQDLTDSMIDESAVPMVYTTPLSAEHLENLESIRWAPGIFQEYVPKALELRITVVAGQVFPVEIHSQEHPRTVHDWRRYPDNLEDVCHLPHQLPTDLEARILRYVEALGLNFGAIDMILTPDGQYVFIEINPNGQFLWIEDLTELPIMESLVQALIRGRPHGQTG